MQTATTGSVQIPVALNPVSGFCVKSRSTNDGLVRLDQPIHAKKGLKVFVNIAWDPNIPPAPPASEDAIQRAMQALDIDVSNPDAWFIPIVLSDARQDSDKAGQPAIVFDCVLNPSIKSRCLKDPSFKRFVIELAFQSIEQKTTLVLSRQIGTPNIASKGKLQFRRVLVSATLYPPGHPNHQAPPTLVQEVVDRPVSVLDKAQPKCILEQSSNVTQVSQKHFPAWSWTQQGSGVRIVFRIPGVTHAVIPQSTLDIEPRRILLHIPALYDLDLNLEASDAELNTIFGKNGTADQALRLKRMRNLDVDNAKAEWRVADKTIVLVA